MRRHSDRNRIAPGSDLPGNAFAHRKDDCEGAGPESVRKGPGIIGNVGHNRLQVGKACYVHDKWIVLRPALGPEDAGNRPSVAGIGAQPVHGLCGERNEPAGSQHSSR